MRRLRHAPVFALTVVLTLAAGIGAVVTMVSVYTSVVLNPIALPQPDRVVAVYAVNTKVEFVPPSLSWPKFDAIRRQSTSFDAVGAYVNASITLVSANGRPEQLRALRVSGPFFEALQVVPTQGRVFRAEDDQPNGPRVCMLSHELWQSRFGAQAVIGSTIQLDGVPTEVIGILPPAVSPPWADRELFLPRVFEDGSLSPQAVSDGATFLEVVARLKPGVSIGQARQDMTSVARSYAREFGARPDASSDLAVQTLTDAVVGNRRPIFSLLLAAVALVLLVACANASTLVLSQLVSRARETAIRQALGARRAVLVREFVGESLLLAALAGVIGTGVAFGALRVVTVAIGNALPDGVSLRVSGLALGVSVVVVIVSSLLVSLLPALHVTRSNAAASVNRFARGLSESRSTRTFRRALVIVEVALSVCLLVQAALLLTSLARLQRTSPGFDPHGVAAAFAILPTTRYPTAEQQSAFFVDVVDRLKVDRRVSGAAVVFGLPFFDGNSASRYAIGGRPIPPSAERPRAGLRIVTEDYFTVMRMQLTQGRMFSAADRAGSKPVCIVNASLARRQFGGVSAVGQTILRGRDANQPFEVIGVVSDVKTNGLRKVTPDEIFYPFRQMPHPDPAIVARTTGDVGELQTLFQSTVAAIDPALPVSRFASMDSRLQGTLGPEQTMATLTLAFATLSLLLCALGVYAVLANDVVTRVGELGVRMALGADPRAIATLVLKQALTLVARGMLAGAVLAVFCAQALATQLFEVRPMAPWVYVVVLAGFAVIGALASLPSALRASRVDPLRAVSR